MIGCVPSLCTLSPTKTSPVKISLSFGSGVNILLFKPVGNISKKLLNHRLTIDTYFWYDCVNLYYEFILFDQLTCYGSRSRYESKFTSGNERVTTVDFFLLYCFQIKMFWNDNPKLILIHINYFVCVSSVTTHWCL